jgi:nucleoside-diphosphate-sugar epimerase
MTVVVTGAAGFIGSHLVEALAARGERAVAVDRRADMPVAATVRIVADLVDAPAGGGQCAVGGRGGVSSRRSSRDPLPHRDPLRHRDNVLAAERAFSASPTRFPWW